MVTVSTEVPIEFAIEDFKVQAPDRAALMANALLGTTVARHALALAFDDVFRTMTYIFLAALILVPLCKPPPIDLPPPLDAH